MRPVQEGRQHLADGVVVAVDGLLAHQDQAGLLLGHHGLEQLGDFQGFDVGVALHQDAAVGAHGQRGADGLLGLLRADRDHDDLAGDALLLQADGLFDGDLAKGIHGHLDVGEIHARLVGLHPHLYVIVDNPFDRDQNLHRFSRPQRLEKWTVGAIRAPRLRKARQTDNGALACQRARAKVCICGIARRLADSSQGFL